MENLLSEGRKALTARLSSVLVSNGYSTNAGANIHTGWFNEVITHRSVAYPLIVLQKAKGLPPKPAPGAVRVYQGFNVVGAVDAPLNDYDDAIEALELDLLRCLMVSEGFVPSWLPRGITGITIGAPEHFPPAEGLKAATVIIPVHLHTIIQVR